MIAAALPLPAPDGWDSTSYRACELCDHRMLDGTDLVCSCPAAVGREQWRPVSVMRASHGSCGPDARHMRFRFDTLHA